MQELIEAEVSARIGAGRYERTPERVTRRNGFREKKLATPSGTLELADPETAGGVVLPFLVGAATQG